MVYILDGVDITNAQFELNGIVYSSEWCSLATPEALLELGIISLTQVYPPISLGYKYSGNYVDNFDNLTRTYEVVATSPFVVGVCEFSAIGDTSVPGILPTDRLLMVVVILANNANEYIGVGSAQGLDDIVPFDNYEKNVAKVCTLNIMVPAAIYFSGSVDSVTYKLYVR